MDQPLEAQLRATLNMIPAYTWYATPSGGLIFVNERNADYGGLPSEHPLRYGTDTSPAWDSHIPFLHPEDQEETRRVWSECLRTGRAGEVSFRIRNAEGNYRWFLSRAEPLRAKDGTLLYWIGVNFDIEERKQAEVELRRSRAYLADAQKLSRTGAVGMEVKAKRIFWSDEAARIYGYPPGTEPTPELILQRAHPDDVDLVKDALARAAAQDGTDFDYEHRLLMPDGSVKHLHDLAHRVRDEAGNEEVVGVIMDITDRKVAEMELRQILDLTPQHVGVLEADGRPLYANRVTLEYFGVTIDEWRALPQAHDPQRRASRLDLVHPDDRKHFLDERRKRFLEGTPHEFEARMRRHDGTLRWFLFRLNPLKDDRGQITRWYGTATDIDDRKTAEERLLQENVALREEVDKASMFEEIVGGSPALTAVLARVSKVASSDSTVLITGETGTGKELVARAIHRRSKRSPRAFIAVNCAAIPRDLIASELFGHEKGAFTGAVQRRLGRFELADGGTIFLDEVGELASETQVALLRVLQEREFERVGGGDRIRVDVRVIAATNRDLSAEVAEGTFRQDLFYRLNVFPLDVPPLRERREDVPLLVEYFIGRYARKAGKRFKRLSKRTLDRLKAYPWPGNIRELQNVIERSVIVSDTDEFTVDESWLPGGTVADSRLGLSGRLSAHEKDIVEEALRASGGRVAGPAGAAARLGLPRSTLESKIRLLKINKSRFRARAPRSS